LRFVNPTKKEIYAMVVLLYPKFAGSLTKKPDPLVLEHLELEGIFLYKGIRKANNKTTMKLFFKDPFIKKIWNYILPFMKFKHCFPEGAA
jgi:hypothetical protein